MAELKIGFKAVFFKGEDKVFQYPIKETYDLALQDIENENDSINNKKTTDFFTHAQVEKVYYRH